MHRGLCQSVKGLKKSFDAEVGDTVSVVKTEIVYRGKQGQKTNELMREIGGYHEENVVIMTEEEYKLLSSGESYAVPKAFISSLKTILTMQVDLLKSCEKEE